MLPETSNLDESKESIATSSLNKFGFLDGLNISSEVRRRLGMHLARLSVGSDEIFMTPLARDNKPESIISGWISIYDNNRKLINRELDDIEISNKLKFGPRSIAKPWSERKNSLYDYFKSTSDISINYDGVVKSNLNSINLNTAKKYLKPNTNSGMPYYVRKSKVIDKTIENYDNILNNEYPCVLFTRTQEGDKTRNVWGYPLLDTLIEMQIYQPLLEYQKKLIWRSALTTPDNVDKEITRMVEDGIYNRKSFFSVDFTSYDASISLGLQKDAFNYIKKKFVISDHNAIDYISNRFSGIGVITPDGIISGIHGVPSGSTFTNEVDSLVQYLIAKSCGIEDYEMQIQGDDGAYCITDLKLDELKRKFANFGLSINESKSDLSSNYLVYLQKLYHIDYKRGSLIGGIYSTFRAIGRICFQERYSDFEDYGLIGQDYYSIRTISILENCKYHPLFRKLVEYVYSKDKYKLKFSRGSTSKYANMLDKGSGTGTFMFNQYGDKVSGIYSFETVKILRELWSS